MVPTPTEGCETTSSTQSARPWNNGLTYFLLCFGPCPPPFPPLMDGRARPPCSARAVTPLKTALFSLPPVLHLT